MRSSDSSKTRQKVLARLGRDTDLSIQMHFLVGLICLLWVRIRVASSHRDSLPLDLLLWPQQSC